MAGRYDANTTDYITLGVEFTSGDTAFDPNILAVEIYDEANNIVDTIDPSMVDHPGPTGYFEVTVGPYSPGIYFDRWRVEDFTGEVTYKFAEGFIVSTGDVLDETPSPTVLSARVHIVSREAIPWGGILNTPVVVCRDSGEVVAQKNTGTVGYIEFVGEPGNYIIVIHDQSRYYQHNVFPITLQEGTEDMPVPLINVFTFATYPFSISGGTALGQIPPDEFCHVDGWLAYHNGEPAAGIDVYVEGGIAIQTVPSGLGHDVMIAKNRVKAGTTDATGFVEFDTLRGGTVIVTIAGTGVQREVIIPDQAEADLSDLVGTGNDILTIVQVPLDGIIRRT